MSIFYQQQVNKEVIDCLEKEFLNNKSLLVGVVKNLSLEQKNFYYSKVMTSGFLKVMGDPSLVLTALELFHKNLNVSETSRDAFLHRNTLIYRLDKIHKLTGYNIKNFEDATTFKLLMVIYYEQNRNKK